MKQIIRRLNTLTTAVDMWLAVICILAAFDRPIPWFVWALFAIEFALLMAKAIEENNDTTP